MGKKGKTVDRVYAEIKNMIYYNMLAPGQRIIYKDLAKRFGVSVTPVIQALKLLERSNLVRYQTNRGYFVGELTEQMVEDLYHVREALEVQTLPLVLRNLDQEALDSIREAFKQYNQTRAPKPEGRVLMLRDAQFHLKIIEYSGNQAVYDILKEVFEQIYLQYKSEYLLESRVGDAYQEHRAILKALGKGDLAEAAALLRDHIRHGKEHVLSIIRLEQEMFQHHKLEVG
ncbi:MAG: GntR family transcriptional regulator [Thermodesulfobacteriota bacterium]